MKQLKLRHYDLIENIQNVLNDIPKEKMNIHSRLLMKDQRNM